MTEAIKLYHILEDKLNDAREFASPKFISCLIEVFALLNSRMLIIDKKMFIEKASEDLFEYLKTLKFFESYDVTLFRTEKGSIYFVDNDYGAIWRFKTDEDSDNSDERKYYEIMEPAMGAVYVGGTRTNWKPIISLAPIESWSDKAHLGHKIVEVYP